MKRAQRKARTGDTRDPLFNQSVEKALAILAALQIIVGTS
jgi:hypothetical protein